MRIIGLAGWSGSGKTTLLARVIPVLTGRGLRVSTVKHAHHGFDVDIPGKDSHTHRSAGATEVFVASARRWAHIHELRGEDEPPLTKILARLAPVDLVVVEGYKRHPHPKLEVYRANVGKPLLHPDDDWIVAVASDAPVPGASVPVLDLGDAAKIADVLMIESVPVDRLAAEAERVLMAQLSDDCFAFGGALLPVEEAGRLMAEQVTPVSETEAVAIAEALGRVVARDVKSPIALPPFDNSAVDGYAVRHADIAGAGETTLKVAGRLQAGARGTPALGERQAIRIFTGAPMPAGADTVYMQEDVRAEGDAVVVPGGLKPGANRRLAGEDLKQGAVALPAGRRLGPQDLALAAAIGLTELEVRRRLRVAVFSTGDEIVEPGTPLGAASLYDANRFLLLALLRELGADADDLGIVRDDADVLAPAIEAAARTHDLVLTSGGVSTGEADHVKSAVERIGKLVFWRLAIKPGRPVAMGVVRGAAFAGLPGNPVAAFVTFVHVVRPLLLRLSGADPTPLAALPVRAAFKYKKKKGRREYVRVGLRRAADGVIEAVKHPQEGAGVLTSLTETDGLAELAEDRVDVELGSTVGFLPYAALVG